MANELTISASLAFAKGNVASVARQIVAGTRYTVTGTDYKIGTQQVPTTAGGTAIDVSGLSGLGWFFLRNLDATNYIEVLNAVSGTVFLTLKAGEVAMGRFGASVTAPAALANTATVALEYMIVED